MHEHYNQLSPYEREFVDYIFGSVTAGGAFNVAKRMGVPLAGDDRIERAVDALARAVIESRP